MPDPKKDDKKDKASNLAEWRAGKPAPDDGGGDGLNTSRSGRKYDLGPPAK